MSRKRKRNQEYMASFFPIKSYAYNIGSKLAYPSSKPRKHKKHLNFTELVFFSIQPHLKRTSISGVTVTGKLLNIKNTFCNISSTLFNI